MGTMKPTSRLEKPIACTMSGIHKVAP